MAPTVHTNKMWDVVQLKTEPGAAFYQYVGSAAEEGGSLIDCCNDADGGLEEGKPEGEMGLCVYMLGGVLRDVLAGMQSHLRFQT